MLLPHPQIMYIICTIETWHEMYPEGGATALNYIVMVPCPVTAREICLSCYLLNQQAKHDTLSQLNATQV